MPITHQLPSETEPGTTYTAWTWGPKLRIEVGSTAESPGLIVVEFESYASAEAAYGGGKPVGGPTASLSTKKYRNWVRANTQIYLDLTAAVDALAASLYPGATVVPGTLPAWASEPMEE